MNPEKPYRLVGLYNPLELYPTFVLPIFESAGKLFTQNGMMDGNITEFLFWKELKSFYSGDLSVLLSNQEFLKLPEKEATIRYQLGDHSELFLENHWQHIHIGQPMVFAFQNDEYSAIIGCRDEMRSMLKECFDWNCSPFLASEVAEFIGDQERYNETIKAASLLLYPDDPKMAEQWEKFTNSTKREEVLH